jgi:hypothetical protein
MQADKIIAGCAGTGTLLVHVSSLWNMLVSELDVRERFAVTIR